MEKWRKHLAPIVFEIALAVLLILAKRIRPVPGRS